MPSDFSSFLLLAGRLLLGGAFLYFGIRNFISFPKLRPGFAAKGLPMPDLALTIGLLLQTAGGALVLFGLFTPWGALAIVLFLVLATVLYHPFWAFEGEERAPHVNAFLTNCALVGGALAVMAATL
ncbi:MAG: DoxX family protein [Devosia sp.]|nr:DoxX family protein [Devosia sp.]